MFAAQINDTPTHRLHILQMDLTQIKSDLEGIRHRRGLIIEKITKAKSNSRIARAAERSKQLKKFFDKMERQLSSLEEDMTEIEDNMNKARALILEESDGEVMVPKTETSTDGA